MSYAIIGYQSQAPCWQPNQTNFIFLPDLLFQRKLPVLFEALIHKASMHKFLQHQFPEKKEKTYSTCCNVHKQQLSN